MYGQRYIFCLNYVKYAFFLYLIKLFVELSYEFVYKTGEDVYSLLLKRYSIGIYEKMHLFPNRYFCNIY